MAGGLMSVAGMNANADTVTVQSGQTLSEIALQNHTTVDAIARANNLQNKNVILTGQKLNVTATNNSQKYTIKSGDTLSGIASKFGVSVSDLMQWNHLNGTLIYPNQVLTINTNGNVVNNNVVTSANVNSNVATQNSSAKAASVSSNVVNKVASSVANTNQNSASHQFAQSNVQQVQQIARPATNSNNNSSGSDASILNSADAQYISNHESGGNYDAVNGQYRGRWQLSASYLNGDYSPAHQDQVFINYCNQRYGGVHQAAQHEREFGWY